MNDGIDLDQNLLIQTLQNKLAQAAIREAQMETAVQQLMGQQNELVHENTDLKAQLEKEEVWQEEVQDVSSADN